MARCSDWPAKFESEWLTVTGVTGVLGLMSVTGVVGYAQSLSRSGSE